MNSEAQDFAPEPQPLLREIPEGAAYPIKALGPLQDAAIAIADITQAPAAICAQAVLSVGSLACQALGDVETLGGRAPASTFHLTIAQSGERKSACDRLAVKGVRDYEEELAGQYREEEATYRNRLDVWQEQRKLILRGAKKDAQLARHELDKLGPEPEPPLYPTLTSGEPTIEGVIKNMRQLRPALGVFSDEGGAFIGGYAMSEDNRLKTVASMSSLWDGTPVSRWRAGDGISIHRGRRVSVHLMTQPVAAAGLLADPVANGQGFLARFLMTAPPSAIGTRTRVGHRHESDWAVDHFAERVGALLRRPLPLCVGTRNVLEPPLIGLSTEARRVLQFYAIEVEKAQLAGGELESVRPFASKAAEHAARLAAVLTLLEDPDSEAIDERTMANAIALAEFYLSEAKRLTDAAVISAETTQGEMLRQWLIESWPEGLISATDVAQYGPGSLRETAKARRAIDLLARDGDAATMAAAVLTLL
jgi:hypothetical protein